MYYLIINDEIKNSWSDKPTVVGDAYIPPDWDDSMYETFNIYKALIETEPPETSIYYTIEENINVINGRPVKSWSIVYLPLEQVKSLRNTYINRQRDIEELAGFDYLNKRFDSDVRAMKRISVAVQAAQAAIMAGTPETFSVEWTCQDNSTLTLSAQDMVGMPVAMATYGNQLHTKARNLKSQINNAETVEDVLAITW